MTSDPVRVKQPIGFGEGYELDLRPRRLRRGKYVVKLERIPLEMLVLLVERDGEVVSRDEIVTRVWGKGVFLDTDNSIRGAIRKLRQALKDDAERPRFIETVTGQGYRFIAPVTLPEEVKAPDKPEAEASTGLGSVPIPEAEAAGGVPGPVSVEEEPGQATKIRRGPRARIWLFLGVAALLLLSVAAFLFVRSRATDAKGPKITSLAVVPLKNLSGDAGQEYLADGMTEEVIGRLSMIHGLRVISRTSVMQLKNTKLLTPEIARMLGVDALVEGSVIREGNRIRVHAQLIRASSDEHFWSESYDRELGDALTLESEIAESIGRKVEATITGQERARLLAARPVSPDVYESYLKGIASRGDRRADVEQRIAYFNRAIEKDPNFAPAYVGLARAYGALGTVLVGARPSETRPRVISNAQRALELDPELAEAHVELANVELSQWRWTEAEIEFRRALDLNPNLAAAHFGLADWLRCHGRLEEALVEDRRGRELDPLGPFAGSIVWGLVNSHRYDEAIREARNVLAVEPDEADTLWDLGWALILNHQPQEAIPVLEKAVSITNRSPGIVSALVWAYARSGRRADALRLVDELKSRQRTGYVPAGAFLNSYLGLGDTDEAFAWFERARQEQSNVLKYIKVFPVFDEVRGDARFQEKIRQVGLN